MKLHLCQMLPIILSKCCDRGVDVFRRDGAGSTVGCLISGVIFNRWFHSWHRWVYCSIIAPAQIYIVLLTTYYFKFHLHTVLVGWWHLHITLGRPDQTLAWTKSVLLQQSICTITLLMRHHSKSVPSSHVRPSRPLRAFGWSCNIIYAAVTWLVQSFY